MEYTIDGKKIKGEEVEISILSNDWTEFLVVNDNNTVKLRPIILKVIRLEDKDPITGLPQYLILSQNVTTTTKNEKKTKAKATA